MEDTVTDLTIILDECLPKAHPDTSCNDHCPLSLQHAASCFTNVRRLWLTTKFPNTVWVDAADVRRFVQHVNKLDALRLERLTLEHLVLVGDRALLNQLAKEVENRAGAN